MSKNYVTLCKNYVKLYKNYVKLCKIHSSGARSQKTVSGNILAEGASGNPRRSRAEVSRGSPKTGGLGVRRNVPGLAAPARGAVHPLSGKSATARAGRQYWLWCSGGTLPVRAACASKKEPPNPLPESGPVPHLAASLVPQLGDAPHAVVSGADAAGEAELLPY